MERLQPIIYKDVVFHLNEDPVKGFDSFMSILRNPARVSAIVIHIKNLVLNSDHGISELEPIFSSASFLESLVHAYLLAGPDGPTSASRHRTFGTL